MDSANTDASFESLVDFLGADDAAAEDATPDAEPVEQADAPEDQPADAEAKETAPEEKPAAEPAAGEASKLQLPEGTPPEVAAAAEKYVAGVQAEYQRKAEEVESQRKTLELRAEAAQMQQQAMAANIEKFAELKTLQEKIKQFEEVDWDALVDSDPTQATKLNLAYQRLQRQAQQVYTDLQQGTARHQQMEREARQAKLAEAAADLKRRIPKWDADADKLVTKTGADLGFTADELGKLIDPRVIQALHEAAKWRQQQAEQKKTLQKLVSAPKAVKPGPAAPASTINQAAFDRLRKRGGINDLAATFD